LTGKKKTSGAGRQTNFEGQENRKEAPTKMKQTKPKSSREEKSRGQPVCIQKTWMSKNESKRGLEETPMGTS